MPKIGERWQFRDQLILEIDNINYLWYPHSDSTSLGFRGNVVQVFSEGRKLGWSIDNKTGGGYDEISTYWICLEGQHKSVY